MPKGLNQKQLNFVQFYSISGNATEAAKQAGYSAKTAQEQGSRLLSHVMVQQELFRLQSKLQATVESKGMVKKERIIQELCSIAFGNTGDLFTWDHENAQFIPKSNLTKEQMVFIDSITVEEIPKIAGYENGEAIVQMSKKYKIGTLGREKVRALDLLSRLLGYDKDGGTEGPEYKAALNDAIAALDQKQNKEKI